ncbi:uncharacterized protein BDW70DRAFT_155792 [Aspergillus foveolatus]|uniref:uncharacterized protein n=1 Tax=Aspergillus foveolatus TaxID=210207 RepID=UPI003CCC99AC
MSKASKKSRKSGASRDEIEALADYLARLAPFVDDGVSPTATRTARRALKHYTVDRQRFLSSLGLDSNMSFPQALNRAVNIVHKLDDDLDEARKELKDTKARNTTLVKGYTMLQEDNTKLKRLKTGIDELKTRNRELQAHNEELQRRNKELERKVNKLVNKNDELQTANHVLENAHTTLRHSHDTLAKDKKDIEMVAINRERQLGTEYAKTNDSQEKYHVVAEELLCRDRERCEAKALWDTPDHHFLAAMFANIPSPSRIKKFNELWTDIVKAWEDVCGSRADRRFRFGVSGAWKHLCDDIWCPDTPLPHSKAADSIRRYCPAVAGNKNADLRTRVRGIIDQASDLRNELEKSQFSVHINPTLVRLEQDPYLSPTVVIFTTFGFAESLGHCNVPGTNPEAVSMDAAV